MKIIELMIPQTEWIVKSLDNSFIHITEVQSAYTQSLKKTPQI